VNFLSLLIVMMGLNTPDYTEVVKSRNHKWLMSPVVRVCADSGVTPPRISNAIAYWQRLGYKFDYTRIDHSIPCPDARFGEIIIMLPDNSFSFQDNLASTRITVSNKTKEIVKAKIFIFPKAASKERVLEHEIGHALGWPHINRPYHIMNSNWHTGGHNSGGLKLKLFYKRYID
tara:strand:- start:1384 stop:1905 length:522 start_codon:yes stop_codon:yes gene_type:complete